MRRVSSGWHRLVLVPIEAIRGNVGAENVEISKQFDENVKISRILTLNP